MKMVRFSKLLLAIPLLMCLRGGAQACTCAISFMGSQPCHAYWKSEIVFVGTVTEIGPMIPLERNGRKLFTSNRQFIRFKIDQAYRGVEGETIETFYQGSSCDYHFKLSERYFVYTNRNANDGRIYVHSCSATKSFDRAADDVAYAEGLKRKEPTPSIVGLVNRRTRKTASEYQKNLTMEGIRVIAEGEPDNTSEVFTDTKGIFRFFGLTPGLYRVRALTPPDLRRLYGEETLILEVKDGRCTGDQVIVTSLSTLSGRVTDSKGAPIKIRVDLIPVDAARNRIAPAEGSIETHSDEQGRYKFDWLAPGRYLVGVNERNQPASNDPPYQRTYYPGVIDRAQAAALELVDGQQLTVDDFPIGPPLISRTIEGVVLLADGTPAANALITLEFTERNWMETASTDREGRFSLKVYEGFKYIVVAELRKQINGTWQATHSPGVEVTVGAVNQPITLTISRPGFYQRQR